MFVGANSSEALLPRFQLSFCHGSVVLVPSLHISGRNHGYNIESNEETFNF
jgi:hypothetical protein